MIFLPLRNTKIKKELHNLSRETGELHRDTTVVHREIIKSFSFFTLLCQPKLQWRLVPYTLYLEPRLGQIYLIIIMVVKMIFEHMI